MSIAMTLGDWASLFAHYLVLSLLTVGGAVSAAPDMHRFLVDERGWLSEAQFGASIAIAQSAPGPNVLFVALIGWNVGLNAGGVGPAFLGMALCLGGIMLPSTVVTYFATRWGHENRNRRDVRAFKQGMTPIVIALLMATGWILATGNGYGLRNWPQWLVTGAATVLVWRTRVHLLWLLAAGAALGWFGLL